MQLETARVTERTLNRGRPQTALGEDGPLPPKQRMGMGMGNACLLGKWPDRLASPLLSRKRRHSMALSPALQNHSKELRPTKRCDKSVGQLRDLCSGVMRYRPAQGPLLR